MKVGQRILTVQESMTLALDAKAKAMIAEGQDVLGFAAGEPDFNTPEPIKRRAIKEIEAGNTKYAPASGTVDLKKAIAAKLKRDNGLDYKPSQIIINCGAKHSLYNIFMTLLDEGDEVIIPAPFWLTYPEQVAMGGGKSVFIQTDVTQNYKITPAQLEAAITPKTVALILNSPSNPTGMLYTREELAALGEVLERHPNVVIVSDEIYEKLIYGGHQHVSIAQISDSLKQRTLLVNGMSKAYAMTGWRMGYVAGDQEFIAAMGRLQSHSTSNPTTFCMPPSVTALEECEGDIDRMRVSFDERRLEMTRLLNELPGVRCPEPMGAFYCFPDVSATYARLGVKGSIEFCEKLLLEAKVALVPGAPFGNDQCVRLSYATGMAKIREGLRRVGEFLRSKD